MPGIYWARGGDKLGPLIQKHDSTTLEILYLTITFQRPYRISPLVLSLLHTTCKFHTRTERSKNTYSKHSARSSGIVI